MTLPSIHARGIGARMPSKWKQHGQCMRFAEAMVKHLRTCGAKGRLLRFSVGRGLTIFSDEFGALGDEGLPHLAVQVGRLVFDNMRPEGVPAAEFGRDMGCRYFHEFLIPNRLASVKFEVL